MEKKIIFHSASVKCRYSLFIFFGCSLSFIVIRPLRFYLLFLFRSLFHSLLPSFLLNYILLLFLLGESRSSHCPCGRSLAYISVDRVWPDNVFVSVARHVFIFTILSPISSVCVWSVWWLLSMQQSCLYRFSFCMRGADAHEAVLREIMFSTSFLIIIFAHTHQTAGNNPFMLLITSFRIFTIFSQYSQEMTL